ncbi:MAG: hypothetical protein ACLR5H_13635 [Oscillospiraceae bacterium]
MAKSNMDQDILKVLITEDEIRNRTQELGDQLYDRFHDKNPCLWGFSAAASSLWRTWSGPLS